MNSSAKESDVARPEPSTREALTNAVKDKLKIDISPLWKWMRNEGHVAKNLTANWDPVWGPGGAWDHLKNLQSLQGASSLEHGFPRISPLGADRRLACKLCGWAAVILLCYYDTIKPIRSRPYVMKMLTFIESQIKELRTMKNALIGHVSSYETSHLEYLKHLFEDAREFQWKASSKAESRKASVSTVNNWCENPGALAELSSYRDLQIELGFDQLEEALRFLQDDALANLLLPFQEAIGPPPVGRPTNLIAVLRTLLKDDGFSWAEVARLVRDDMDIRRSGEVIVDGRQADRNDAFRVLHDETAKVKSGGYLASTKISFGDYVVSLFDRKVAKGKIRSAKGREKWELTLRLHLIPRFGRFEMAKLPRGAIEAWLKDAGWQVQAEKSSPHTTNTHAALRVHGAGFCDRGSAVVAPTASAGGNDDGHLVVALPAEMMDILRWHVANLPKGPMASSELLFPSETGSFRSMSTLDKPFDSIVKAIGLKKRLTPKGMRRTYQDLARKANVPEIVARNICGNATVAMQEHYSTIAREEVRSAVSNIISLVGYKGILEGRNALGAASRAAQPSKPATTREDEKKTITQPLDGKEVSA